jgi:elongation factor Ts
MANITAAEVNKLRQITGAGMMDCKKALVESDGDIDKAIDYLRKKGQKVASNRADRDAKDGYVIAKTNPEKNYVAMIMLNCETDFVAKNKDFINMAEVIISKAIEDKPASEEELKNLKIEGRPISDHLTDLIGKIGEKVELNHFYSISAPATHFYNHAGNRLAAIVGYNKALNEEVAKDISMQIAAMNPVAIDKDDVDSKVIENEIEIGKEQARQEGKPEEMLEKIALGKLNKFYKESTLLNQEFIKDSKKTVGQYMAESDKELKVLSFKRLMLGE